jgi:hypothetical protein
MIEPEIAFAGLWDNAALAEALLKYTFAELLKEREEDLAFFDQRIEEGLIAKLEGIVGSEFVHMDYGEAIQVLERSNEKFEFPVQWGVDLQSEHERYLTEKHAKKPVIVINYPKAIKAFYMRRERRRPHRRGDGRIGPGDRRDHRRQPARRAVRGIGPDHGRARHRQGRVRLVPRSPPLRHGAAAPSLTLPLAGREGWGLRAHAGVRHRPGQRARRHPLPAHPRAAGYLGQIVEVDVERDGDLLQRLDRPLTFAVLDLRQVADADPGTLSELAQ